MIRSFFTTFIMLLTSLLVSAHADVIRIHVAVPSNQGTIGFGAFVSQAAFDAQEFISGVRVPASAGPMILILRDLAPGTYGIVGYHDVNANGQLDQNIFGIPTEPFGFANNPALGLSGPRFSQFSVQFDGTPMDLHIQLKSMF